MTVLGGLMARESYVDKNETKSQRFARTINTRSGSVIKGLGLLANLRGGNYEFNSEVAEQYYREIQYNVARLGILWGIRDVTKTLSTILEEDKEILQENRDKVMEGVEEKRKKLRPKAKTRKIRAEELPQPETTENEDIEMSDDEDIDEVLDIEDTSDSETYETEEISL